MFRADGAISLSPAPAGGTNTRPTGHVSQRLNRRTPQNSPHEKSGIAKTKSWRRYSYPSYMSAFLMSPQTTGLDDGSAEVRGAGRAEDRGIDRSRACRWDTGCRRSMSLDRSSPGVRRIDSARNRWGSGALNVWFTAWTSFPRSSSPFPAPIQPSVHLLAIRRAAAMTWTMDTGRRAMSYAPTLLIAPSPALPIIQKAQCSRGE